MPTTLGFVGNGLPPSEAMLEALLEDQVVAAGPTEFVLPFAPIPGTAPVEAWARFHGITVRYRDEVVSDVWQPDKLLVFWAEDDSTRNTVSVALDYNLEVRDLNSALTRIDKLKEKKLKIYTRDELLDEKNFPETELIAIAKSYGVTDHTEYDSWEEVVEIILEGQAAAQEEAADDEEEDEPKGAYTRAELESLELSQLKEIVQFNDIHVEGIRPRTKTYIEAILAAQAEDDDESEEEEESEEPTNEELEAIEAESGVDTEALAEDVANRVLSGVVTMFDEINDVLGRLETAITDLTAKVDKLNAPPSRPGPGPRTPPSPTALAAKKAGIRRLPR